MSDLLTREVAESRNSPYSSVGHWRRAVGVLWRLLTGVVATGAGAGLGPRHLQKSGLGVVSLVGLLLLAAGLVTLADVARRGWRGWPGWRRLLLVPSGFVVLIMVMSIALAFMYAVTPRPALGSATPMNYGLSYRAVTFRTTDGQLQSAWYTPSRNGAAVVLRHGAGSTRTAALPQGAVLARHGYGVLLTDARGHGRSRGRGMDLGWYGDLDIAAAVSFLRRQPDVDDSRVGVVGLSMGGEEAIGAAAADLRIRAVVAEGATARTAADKARWLPGGLAGWMQRRIDSLTYGLTELLTPAERPQTLRSAVATATATPFLLITAGRQPDETSAATDLQAAGPERVQIWRVSGAGHTGGLGRDPRGWEGRVISFLGRELAR